MELIPTPAKQKKRQPFLIVASSVIPPGLEPGTPTLKVLEIPVAQNLQVADILLFVQ